MSTSENSGFGESMDFSINDELQNIIRHSSSLFYAHTPDGTLTYLSDQSKNMLDCEPEHAMSTWQEFTTDHPENAQGIKSTELAIHTGVKQPKYTLQLKTRTGRLIWVEVDESPVVKNGTTIAIVGSLTEISERKKLEERLKLKQEKLRLVIESSPIGIVIRKPHGELITYNKRFTEIFGIEKGKYTHVDELYPIVYPNKKYRDQVIPEWEKHIKEYLDGGHFRPFEAQLACDDGSTKTIEIGFGAIEELYITTFVDVTERKNILAEVERNKALLSDNENLSKTGAWEYDVKTQEMYWTDGLYDIHEIDKNQCRDETEESLKCYDEKDRQKVLTAFRECIEHGKPYDLVFPFTTPRSNRKWVRSITRPILENEKVVKVIGTLMDITKQVQTETQLKQLNATKDKLFSIVSHDLRNPIGAIINIANLALESIDESNLEELKTLLNSINKSGQRSFDLLNNLLEWSSLNTGRISMETTNFPLHPCVAEIEDLHRGQLNNKEIELVNHVPEDFILRADKDMINTVLRNLVSNAIKFTPSMGRIQLQARSTDQTQVISISDNGIGMEPGHVDTLFNGKSFITKAGTNNEKGTGLGLMLCHEFIKLHNGEIKASSQLGQGTTFEIRLPRK